VNPLIKRLIFWTPRVLCILFAAFISLFALDVFNEGRSFGETILALLIHLVPTGLIVLTLVLSWRWEWVGAVLFSALGVLYLTMAWGKISWILTISGPLFLVAILFFLSWRYRGQLRDHPSN